MKRSIIALVPLVSLFCGSAAGQSVYLSDDFESYANTAEMLEEWEPNVADTFELRSGEGDGAGESNKWIAQTDTSTISYLTRELESPMPTNTENSVHIYMRANDWTNTRSGVSLLSEDGSAMIFIGTHNGSTATGNPGNYFVGRAMGTHTPPRNQRWRLNFGPERVPGVWTKLEVRQSQSAIYFEINDVTTPANTLATQRPAAPYTKVQIGVGPAEKVVQYDNVFVWAGPDTGVVDWDLY